MNDRKIKQFRMIIDEVNVIRTFDKGRLAQHVDQEADVRLDATNTEFTENAEHLLYGLVMMQAIGRCLDEKGIIVRRNNGTGIGVAAIETNAKAAATTIDVDLTGVRHEVVHRIFRRNTALALPLHWIDSWDLMPISSLSRA